MRDFGKRVDICAGNLLVFVALNFTISESLPRLGYLTFLDALMLLCFVVSGLVVILNVVFRRLEVAGREALARQIDRHTIWACPVGLASLIVLHWELYQGVPEPM